MFSNLQNKIDLRKIQEGKIEVDNDFAFKEDFDVVNQTIQYFEKKKNTTNNIIIKEEVIEYEDDDLFNYLDNAVDQEQDYIYNDDKMLDDIKDNVESDEEEAFDESFSVIEENYKIFHKNKKPLPQLLEDANKEMELELDKYRMVDGEKEDMEQNGYDVEALFDKDVLDKARKEQLNHIYTMDWLSKQLVDYRNAMRENIKKSPVLQVNNNLKKLDITDPSEIINKIKDLNESISFLQSKKLGV